MPSRIVTWPRSSCAAMGAGGGQWGRSPWDRRRGSVVFGLDLTDSSILPQLGRLRVTPLRPPLAGRAASSRSNATPDRDQDGFQDSSGRGSRCAVRLRSTGLGSAHRCRSQSGRRSASAHRYRPRTPPGPHVFSSNTAHSGTSAVSLQPLHLASKTTRSITIAAPKRLGERGSGFVPYARRDFLEG